MSWDSVKTFQHSSLSYWKVYLVNEAPNLTEEQWKYLMEKERRPSGIKLLQRLYKKHGGDSNA